MAYQGGTHGRLAVLLAALLAAPAALATLPTDGELSAAEIRRRIENRDCSGAVERLKQALAKNEPEAALMGGSMYEHGVCVKRDWQRAIPLYARAVEGGQPEGAERLAAGFADPVNGPDAAAAIWWAWRGRGFDQSECGVDGKAPADPERLVAEMGKWKPERLAYCTYVAGVMSTISAEMRFPDLARGFAVGGDVSLRFYPATPRFELKQTGSREYDLVGYFAVDRLRDRKRKAVTGGFEKVVGEVADRALRRYPHPKGIPEDTLIQTTYTFGYTLHNY
ncbi:hypothetical protein LK542_03950 [Massilia sp. IC2-477]|uniref:hypothetical protein n=1 Tax=unclassified Massilia TaxID=2609279 RepID=UPI001D0F63F0|nr:MULTISPECIES: hypothetical protein [unclassified Massilia]MCC2954766.1 hypothetical protein [Massilia sp. IC2-477]MCC2972758.1 hypothetical protein [Massilia sp. IC2-476]